MKPIIFVPSDDSERSTRFNKQFLNSLRKFHPDIEVKFFPNPNPTDTDFWYRAKPIIAHDLFKEGYDTVIGMDNDQIILGSLDEILNDEEKYDVGVVLNDPSYPIQVWDIQPIFNNGLVVLKNPDFVEHWKRLCLTPHFQNYQFREQDILNILCSDYMNYKVKLLELKKLYGECAKPFWAQARLEKDQIIIDTQFGPKQLCVIHFGGGNTPDKGNYRIRFREEIVKKIEELIS